MPKKYVSEKINLVIAKGAEIAKLVEKVRDGKASVSDIDKLATAVLIAIPGGFWVASPYLAIRITFRAAIWTGQKIGAKKAKHKPKK